MSNEGYSLSFTGEQIDERLRKVGFLVASVNGLTPDNNGNVEIVIPDEDYIKELISNEISKISGSGGMTLSGALLSPGYTVMDSMGLSVEIEEQEET